MILINNVVNKWNINLWKVTTLYSDKVNIKINKTRYMGN